MAVFDLNDKFWPVLYGFPKRQHLPEVCETDYMFLTYTVCDESRPQRL